MAKFTKDELRRLVDRPEGPCVSIYMPTERAGREVRQNGIRFKNLVRQARASLEQAEPMSARELDEWFAPARDLMADESFWQHQRDGLAWFRSADLTRAYRAPLRFDELTVVARRFHVKPLLRLLTGDGRYYVLSLAQEGVALYECTRDSLDRVDLGDTPTSMLDVVGHDVEPQHLQWHTGTGSGTHGERSAEFHGQGGGEDDVEPELRRFLSAVDRGVRTVLADREAPLVLAGAERLLPIYREVSGYPRIVEEDVRAHPASQTDRKLLEKAWKTVEPEFSRERAEASERFRATMGTGKASDALDEVVPSSHEGRVDILFVASGEQRWGTYEPGRRRVRLDGSSTADNQDLLDYAAVQTLLHGGTVYAVDPGEVPSDNGPVAALFRY